jgi:O-antigen/teichoic acid export membrane protein
VQARRLSLPRATALLGASTLGANGLAVIFQVVVSRLLGPSSYGALGALIALTLIVGVPGMALQVIVARHTVLRDSEGGSVQELWASALRLVLIASSGAVILIVALAPTLMHFLRLGSIVPVLWLAMFCGAVPVVSVLQGMLQGRERFDALASVVIATAVARFTVGYLLALAFGVSGAVAGAAAGVALGLVLALRAARPDLRRGRGIDRRIGRELGQAGLVLAALTVLVYLDQAVARHYLAPHESGLYAVGALIAGALFWGSAFAGWAVFPRLAVASERERTRIVGRTGAFVGALCLVALVVLAVAARVTLRSLFGPSYAGLGASLWLFAAAGTAYALLQILVLSDIARARASTTAGVILLGIVVKTTLIATLFHRSVAQIATAVLLTSVAVLVVALVVQMVPLRSRRAKPSGDPKAST